MSEKISGANCSQTDYENCYRDGMGRDEEEWRKVRGREEEEKGRDRGKTNCVQARWST